MIVQTKRMIISIEVLYIIYRFSEYQEISECRLFSIIYVTELKIHIQNEGRSQTHTNHN